MADLIADDIIERVARDRRIEPAVKQLIAHAVRMNPPGATSATCEHTFECQVDGQRYDVKISLEVAGKQKH